ncbi:amidohydrolase [Actinomadura sp. DC4]|uniref:amidohydrolase n=1 Tax=Actinomadura sp. DC4 TaxID=3055069 RepID=UPI0025AF0BDE|nr:amidohydrolase [Actinomadura sp. DC4]MDN3353605.1 amidohydrolase [Actinomadura sp. DC4]
MTELSEAALDDLAELYRDLHRNPEPPFGEVRTAGIVAGRLRRAGFEVATGIGGTGVAGVLRSGEGPAVLLRADMDALPLAERTGLPYASTVTAEDAHGERTPLMHACGHDMHVACLSGAADLLAAGRGGWRGTVLVVFQPAEEIAAGARAMLDDGLYDRFGTPDVALGQHVFPYPAGTLLHCPGQVLGAAETLEVRLHGKGSHGSQPERGVDPVVLAAAVVMRLQTVVSREVSPAERAVVTVARLRAGHAENVIPDEATMTLNIRAFSPDVMRGVLAAVERIVRAEADASGAPRPPELRTLSSFPATFNDPDATERVASAFADRFGAERVGDLAPMMGSEDFGLFGSAAGVPSVFWGLGSAGEEDAPGNHSPLFAPVVEPTLSTGVEALVTAARTFLGEPAGA